MVEYVELSIDELILDQDNPRLGSVNSQSEALEAIVHLNESHFRNLMLSIKDNGLDPGDSFYVIEAEKDGDYVVLEGNRRLSALYVLNDADILDGTEVPDAIKKSLARANAGFKRTDVEPIRCVVFDHRADANEWIYRRHTGGADGEGRIQWGPLEVQRFSGDRSVLDVIDFVGRNADYTDDEWESTKSVIESRKSSNIARLLESAPGRKHLGITIAKGAGSPEKTPILNSEPKWVLAVLRRVIEDVRDGVIDSRDLNKASDIEAYFLSLPKNLQPKATKSVSPRAFKDIDLKPRPKPTTGGTITKPKTKPVPRPRRTLAPKRHPFNVPTSPKGETLLREAGNLDADKFKISAAFVLRAFVELSIHEYMSANGLPEEEKNSKGEVITLNLTQKAERVLQDVTRKKKSKSSELRGFRKNILTKSSPCSIQSLNDFVHGKYQIPTADMLRSGWDSAVPVFIAAYGNA